jgi:hypothetical protein
MKMFNRKLLASATLLPPLILVALCNGLCLQG